jgi:hypothetical protein
MTDEPKTRFSRLPRRRRGSGETRLNRFIRYGAAVLISRRRSACSGRPAARRRRRVRSLVCGAGGCALVRWNVGGAARARAGVAAQSVPPGTPLLVKDRGRSACVGRFRADGRGDRRWGSSTGAPWGDGCAPSCRTRGDAETTALELQALQRVTALLSTARDPLGLRRRCSRAGSGAMGARWCGARVQPGAEALVDRARDGYPPGALDEFQAIPLEAACRSRSRRGRGRRPP